jgi:hypothetical protein
MKRPSLFLLGLVIGACAFGSMKALRAEPASPPGAVALPTGRYTTSCDTHAFLYLTDTSTGETWRATTQNYGDGRKIKWEPWVEPMPK